MSFTDQERKTILCYVQNNKVLGAANEQLVLEVKNLGRQRWSQRTHRILNHSPTQFSAAAAAEALHQLGQFLAGIEQEKPHLYEQLKRWAKRDAHAKEGNNGKQTT